MAGHKRPSYAEDGSWIPLTRESLPSGAGGAGTIVCYASQEVSSVWCHWPKDVGHSRAFENATSGENPALKEGASWRYSEQDATNVRCHEPKDASHSRAFENADFGGMLEPQEDGPPFNLETPIPVTQLQKYSTFLYLCLTDSYGHYDELWDETFQPFDALVGTIKPGCPCQSFSWHHFV